MLVKVQFEHKEKQITVYVDLDEALKLYNLTIDATPLTYEAKKIVLKKTIADMADQLIDTPHAKTSYILNGIRNDVNGERKVILVGDHIRGIFRLEPLTQNSSPGSSRYEKEASLREEREYLFESLRVQEVSEQERLPQDFDGQLKTSRKKMSHAERCASQAFLLGGPVASAYIPSVTWQALPEDYFDIEEAKRLFAPYDPEQMRNDIKAKKERNANQFDDIKRRIQVLEKQEEILKEKEVPEDLKEEKTQAINIISNCILSAKRIVADGEKSDETVFAEVEATFDEKYEEEYKRHFREHEYQKSQLQIFKKELFHAVFYAISQHYDKIISQTKDNKDGREAALELFSKTYGDIAKYDEFGRLLAHEAAFLETSFEDLEKKMNQLVSLDQSIEENKLFFEALKEKLNVLNDKYLKWHDDFKKGLYGNKNYPLVVLTGTWNETYYSLIRREAPRFAWGRKLNGGVLGLEEHFLNLCHTQKNAVISYGRTLLLRLNGPEEGKMALAHVKKTEREIGVLDRLIRAAETIKKKEEMKERIHAAISKKAFNDDKVNNILGDAIEVLEANALALEKLIKLAEALKKLKDQDDLLQEYFKKMDVIFAIFKGNEDMLELLEKSIPTREVSKSVIKEAEEVEDVIGRISGYELPVQIETIEQEKEKGKEKEDEYQSKPNLKSKRKVPFPFISPRSAVNYSLYPAAEPKPHSESLVQHPEINTVNLIASLLDSHYLWKPKFGGGNYVSVTENNEGEKEEEAKKIKVTKAIAWFIEEKQKMQQAKKDFNVDPTIASEFLNQLRVLAAVSLLRSENNIWKYSVWQVRREEHHEFYTALTQSADKTDVQREMKRLRIKEKDLFESNNLEKLIRSLKPLNAQAIYQQVNHWTKDHAPHYYQKNSQISPEYSNPLHTKMQN